MHDSIFRRSDFNKRIGRQVVERKLEDSRYKRGGRGTDRAGGREGHVAYQVLWTVPAGAAIFSVTQLAAINFGALPFLGRNVFDSGRE